MFANDVYGFHLSCMVLLNRLSQTKHMSLIKIYTTFSLGYANFWSWLVSVNINNQFYLNIPYFASGLLFSFHVLVPLLVSSVCLLALMPL